MAGLAEPGGHVALTVPYNEREYHPNAYDLPGSSYGQDNPYVTQIYSRAEVDAGSRRAAASWSSSSSGRCSAATSDRRGAHLPVPEVGVDDRQLSCRCCASSRSCRREDFESNLRTLLDQAAAANRRA